MSSQRQVCYASFAGHHSTTAAFFSSYKSSAAEFINWTSPFFQAALCFIFNLWIGFCGGFGCSSLSLANGGVFPVAFFGDEGPSLPGSDDSGGRLFFVEANESKWNVCPSDKAVRGNWLFWPPDAVTVSLPITFRSKFGS
jgi:hypothetical protein